MLPTLLSGVHCCPCPFVASHAEVQQVQQRIAATLQSVLTTAAIPAVVAGTVAFPGCVHILCTIASQSPEQQQQQTTQQMQQESEAAVLCDELQQQLAAALPGSCSITAVQHMPGAEAAAEETGGAPAAAIALQPAVLTLDSCSSSIRGSAEAKTQQLGLTCASGLSRALQRQGYSQLRVVVGKAQQMQQQQQLLFDRCWELQELLSTAVVEFEFKLDAGMLAGAKPGKQQHRCGCLSVGVLACRQQSSAEMKASKGTGSGSGSSSSQVRAAQPLELVLKLLPLPLLPSAAAAELKQLQERAEMGNSGFVHAYNSVMLPVLQDLQCAIQLYGNAACSSSSSNEGDGDCSGSDCSHRDDGSNESGARDQDTQFVMSAVGALHAYFARLEMSACCRTLEDLCGSCNLQEEEQQQQQQQAELAAAAAELLSTSKLSVWGSCIFGALLGWKDRQLESAYAAAAVEVQQPLRWVQAAVLCAVDVAACLMAGMRAVGLMLQHASEAAVAAHTAWELAAACACLWGIAAGLYVWRSLVAFYSSGEAATGLAMLRLGMQLAHWWVASANAWSTESFGESKSANASLRVAGIAAVAPALTAGVHFGSWAACLIFVAVRVVLHRLLAHWLLLHAGLEAALVVCGVWRFKWHFEQLGLLQGKPVWLQILLAVGPGVAFVAAAEARSRMQFLYALRDRGDKGIAALQSGVTLSNPWRIKMD
jgi:hypothetical protein